MPQLAVMCGTGSIKKNHVQKPSYDLRCCWGVNRPPLILCIGALHPVWVFFLLSFVLFLFATKPTMWRHTVSSLTSQYRAQKCTNRYMAD